MAQISTKLKIGIVTEGEGEVIGLPKIYRQISEYVDGVILRPMHVVVDPQAPIPLLCKRAAKRIQFAKSRGATVVLLLLDTESLAVEPEFRSRRIQDELGKLGHGDVRVVMKHTCFENWLISDPTALTKQNKLFPNASIIQYPAGRADNVNAVDLLRKAVGKKGSYLKMKHPERILSKSLVASMRGNSQSFNSFILEISSCKS